MCKRLSFIFAVVISIYPNPRLTPGKTNPVLTKEVICSPSFRTGPYRNVPESEKKKVFEEYGISWSEHSKYEVDHWYPLCLAGSNDLKNLWAMPYKNIVNGENLGARQKDVVEVGLYKELCREQVTLDQAHHIIDTNWDGCYHTLKKGGICH